MRREKRTHEKRGEGKEEEGRRRERWGGASTMRSRGEERSEERRGEERRGKMNGEQYKTMIQFIQDHLIRGKDEEKLNEKQGTKEKI